MGRLAIADEQLWTNCKQYQPSKGYVVGLILGQPSKAADYIVHLARLPPPDNIINDKDPSTKAPVQGHLLTEIKDAWVTSHASDVTRMLPGGMWVLGLFLIGESDPFDNQPSCTRLRNVLRHMQGELKKNPSLHGDSPSEKLLLYLNVQRNILVCKSVDLEGSAAFRPAEWKFQKNPIAWTQIDSILDLNFATYLNKEDTIKQLKSQLNDVLSAVSKQVSESICTLSNELLDEDDLVDSIFQKKSKGSKKGKGGCQDQPKKLTANLYEPMVGEVGLKRTTDLELSESHGVMYFVGSPTSRVFINQKSTFAEACRAVKQDITRSIATRLQMHVDSLVEEEPNPREDYLFPGEGPEEALLSSEDLLDLSLQLEDIETDIEVPADYGTRQQQQDIEQIEDSKEVALAASSEKSSYIVLVTLGALFCVLLGFLIQSFVL